MSTATRGSRSSVSWKELGNGKVTHLSFRTANFALFMDLLGITIWECAIENG